MRIRTTITSLFNKNTDGIGTFYPFRSTKNKRRQTCISPKVVKFDHFKIGIVNYFPSSKKFNRIAVSNPILDYISRSTISLFG